MQMFDLKIELLAPLFLAATLVACSDDLSMGPGERSEPEVIETTNFHASLEITLSEYTKTETGLYYKSIEDGKGTILAAAGDTVSVYYGAWLSNGTALDPGEIIFIRGDGTTAAKTLPGEGAVILGFDQGVEGMKLGGIRQIIVPPDLAYGNNWVGSVIPPGSIMVFRAHMNRINDRINSGDS